MRHAIVAVLGAVALLGCPPANNTDGGTGGGSGGGGGAGGGSASDPFAVTVLDPAAVERQYLAAAFDPVNERVGVVYYTPRGTQTVSGHPDYDIKYVEWNKGVVSAIETIRFVQRTVGLAIAFHPTTGEPVVSYLGGNQGFVPGETIYWFQSDAVLNARNAGTWNETIVAVNGLEVTCGNPVSDRDGILVGLWPALAFDSTGKAYFAWRDGHDAQFPQQDWNGSDVELAEGPLGAVAPTTCVNSGGNNKQAWGGRIQMIIGAGDQPVMAYDQAFGGADTSGQNVFVQRRQASGAWTSAQQVLSVARTQSGPSIAYDATEGLGLAVYDLSTGILAYTKSINGMTWSATDDVFGSGSGGWYPSLAMDPINHEPAIAYHVCSARTGVGELVCPASEDELRVAQRIVGNWRETVVDTEGGFSPKLAFFASGKRVVAYRDPRSGAVKLAVER